MVKRYLGTLLMVLAVTALMVGCNGGGGPTASFVPSGSSSFTAPTTPDTGGGGEVGVTHSPEPATMLLWGVGLAGAALLRRRKK